MSDGRDPTGSPEDWERDDLSRMRRIHEDLEREYLRIPPGPCSRKESGDVPGLVEHPSGRGGA